MEEKEVQGAPVHKRRVRYSGTHPRRFEEKYKEQNPEKYADTIEKVIKKGSTPAGMHRFNQTVYAAQQQGRILRCPHYCCQYGHDRNV